MAEGLEKVAVPAAYEMPNVVRPKRWSRTTANSQSPEPLPAQTVEGGSKRSSLDPRGIASTLHASLVAEILSLRRELESKSHLVENLETSLAAAKAESDTLQQDLARHAKDARQTKVQLDGVEKEASKTVEGLAKERDEALEAVQEVQARLEAVQQRTRKLDQDSTHTKGIWESEKQQWEAERRQLEWRLHVSESRLRAFIDAMATTRANAAEETDNRGDSDAASLASATPKTHRRLCSEASSLKSLTGSPEQQRHWHSLADELDECLEDAEDEPWMPTDSVAALTQEAAAGPYGNLAPAHTQATAENVRIIPPLSATVYMDVASQTDFPDPVPAIAIQPPTPRQSYKGAPVLPPNTKNASCQTELPKSSRDAGVQTDQVLRIDPRVHQLPARILQQKRPLGDREKAVDGPLNRSAQYGVTRPLQSRHQLLGVDSDSGSDYEDARSHVESKAAAAAEAKALKIPELDTRALGTNAVPNKTMQSEAIGLSGTVTTLSRVDSNATARSQLMKQRNPSFGSMASSGFAPPRFPKHQRTPSLGSMASSNFSARTNVVPPYPIPNRSSSRQPPQTYSEGCHSPTPQAPNGLMRRQFSSSSRPYSNSLRKVRSAAAMRGEGASHKGRRPRRSPDLTPVQSMAFDSPAISTTIAELPADDVVQSPDITDNVVQPPDTPVSEAEPETNLVDAIAATMVGEWMWKYMRQPKSFAAGDGAGGDGAHSGGSRHKRWVWLSPYERTVMWDSKQPTTGSALLGKKGRKLAIQSVMDLADDTPAPRGAGGLDSVYSRSIVVFTPQRALKFTTTSEERHIVWMTALGFLSQAGRISQIPTTLRPKPPIQATSTPSKKKHLPALDPKLNHPDIPLNKCFDGAEYPTVPRSSKQKRRSATLTTDSNGNFNIFKAGPPYSETNHYHDTTPLPPAPAPSIPPSGKESDQVYFEQAGEIRMEAFVDERQKRKELFYEKPRGRPWERGRSGSAVSAATTTAVGGMSDDGSDPFYGF
ncbi:hypothetical protein K470DRAFT_296745 [Piedraia hortae CBS 480.64]|uniref:Pleckstrin homology domain-containing protein n=1 Tax=Piedraia hortae CBS 480.64 TaxID=1314780 RepID=A0A6A7BRV4_9PEZI|nr:hypothetical protein K470DRAFT_296745 [Piedraia hortae CBS 480.64]